MSAVSVTGAPRWSAPRPAVGPPEPAAPRSAANAIGGSATAAPYHDILVVDLDDQRVGLLATQVIELSPVVASTPLPGAPAFVDGVVDWRGHAVPVVDLRARVGRPHRPVRLSDHLIIAQAATRTVALRVDRARELVTLPREELESAIGLKSASHVAGLVRLATGLVVVHDLNALLSAEEGALLDQAMDAVRSTDPAAAASRPAPTAASDADAPDV